MIAVSLWDVLDQRRSTATAAGNLGLGVGTLSKGGRYGLSGVPGVSGSGGKGSSSHGMRMLIYEHCSLGISGTST
jgi:hypothetical protein